MITNIILLFLYGIVLLFTSPLKLLDDVSMTGFSATIASISSYIAIPFSILPVFLTTLISTWGAYVVYEGALFLYKGIKWVYTKIPGIS